MQSFTDMDVKLFNAYISANLMFLSAQRPAAIRNMTITEYLQREENDEAEGCYLIKVAQHKTASRGPARVFVNKDIGTLMDIYYHNVRSVIKPLCTDYETRFFLTPTGNVLSNLSEKINKAANLFNIETPTATVHRKVVSTETKKQKQDVDAICSQMSHSRATCEKFYQHISTEQSFSVQSTIQKLCNSKFFQSDQSELIKLEWPLSNHHSIPLALCRELSKKYKRLHDKTDRQIQDHWKTLKKIFV